MTDIVARLTAWAGDWDAEERMLDAAQEITRLRENVRLGLKLFGGAILPEDEDPEGDRWLKEARELIG